MADIVSIGEMTVDLTAMPSENGGTVYQQHAGGAPANAVCMASSLGASAAFIGKLGDDMFGEYLMNTLVSHNVDIRGVITDSDYSTAHTFIRKGTEGEREYLAFRTPEQSADINLNFREIDKSIIDECRIFHFGASSMIFEPSGTAVLGAVEYAKEQGKTVCFDTKLRYASEKNKDDVARMIRSAVKYADIVITSESELQLITDCGAFIPAAAAVLGMGVKILCATQGAKGCIIASRRGIERYPSYNTKIADTLVAGECFCGAFLYMLNKTGKHPNELESEEIREIAMFSNACGALSSSNNDGHARFPLLSEIEELMNGI